MVVSSKLRSIRWTNTIC